MKIIIFAQKIIAMKKISLTLLIFALAFSTFAQHNSTTVFAADAPTGWANLRAGAGTNYQTVDRLPDRAIVFRDPDRATIGNWIPVINGWVHTDRRDEMRYWSYRNSSSTVIRFGYMHQSVLAPVQEPYASRLTNFFPKHNNDDEWDIFRQAVLMSSDTPELFLILNDNGFVVHDFRTDRTVFAYLASPPIAVPTPIFGGDTIRFYQFWGNREWRGEWGQLINPMLAVYTLFRNEKGEFDFRTDLFPQPLTVSIERAEEIVATIRQTIARDLGGDYRELFMHPHFSNFVNQLFLAYVSGVKEAWDIIGASGCDASICHELDFIAAMFDAFRRSRLNVNRGN